MTDFFNKKSVPLAGAGDLDALIDTSGSRRLVLLGESTHGTTEFYKWRAEITKRLISEKKFSFIAVEGDWASIYRLNEFVKGKPGAPETARRVLRGFDRWPEWMWGNTDIEELAEWLREFNSHLHDSLKVGFYGMDVYGQWQAMDDLIAYSGKYIPEYHQKIKQNLLCFAGFGRDEWLYARSVSEKGYPSCEEGLNEVVGLLERLSPDIDDNLEKKHFRAIQNAIVVKNAEDFFRLAVKDNTLSWNSRATHMWETVYSLLKRHGNNSRGVVWAHNTHVGDADATTMRFQNLVNIGKLSREQLGAGNVLITGFGTFKGRVNAGMRWGSAMHRMVIPEGIMGSYEHIMAQLDHEDFYLIFDKEDSENPLLMEFRPHRAIGVVYNPRQEAGNYEPTILPSRYDAFIFIRETNPLRPVR